MLSESAAIQAVTVPHEDWERTPASVQAVVSRQQEIIVQLMKRVEELETRLGQNSQNSNRPPSTDPPYQREKRKKAKAKGKPGSKKGHKGFRQSPLEPTKTIPVPPKTCECGCG